jgi:hypothetical protein
MQKAIKLLTIVTVVAASASSAFAANANHRDHARTTKLERYSGPLFEGRNSAPSWDYSTSGTSSGRDAMVQSLGN